MFIEYTEECYGCKDYGTKECDNCFEKKCALAEIEISRGGSVMNKYLVAIRHFFEGYRTFEIDADNKSDALIKCKEYVRRIGSGNYNLDDAKVIKKLKK